MNNDSELDELAPWLVILITLLGGWLRVYLLNAKGLWLDEAFSLWVAKHSAGEMLQWIVQIDQHPPLYYLLLHEWIGFRGETLYSVRFLSALFGAATIPLVYLIGKRISGSVVGLAAAIFLALSPFNIRFGQELRMYSLLTFNAAAAIYALTRLLNDPRSARPIGGQFGEYLRAWRSAAAPEPAAEGDFSYKDQVRRQGGWRAWVYGLRWPSLRIFETDLAWAAFIFFTAAMLYSHNTAVLFLLAVNIYVIGLMLARKARPDRCGTPYRPETCQVSFANWIKAQIGIFLLWSPWLLPFIQQASRVYQEFWIPAPTWEMIVRTLVIFLNDTTLGDPGGLWAIWLLYALVFGLGVAHYRKKKAQLLFLAALFAVPFLGELLVSIRRPIFYPRTLIWITIPLFVLLAAGVAQLRYRLLMIVVAGILATNNLFAAGDYYKFMQKEDWGNAAGYVANFIQQDDLILFNASWVQIPFDYYFTGWEHQYSFQVEKHGLPVDLFDRGVLEPKMTAADIPYLLSLVEGRQRVWLVYSHNWYTDPEGLIPQALAGAMRLAVQREYYGVLVQLYEAP